MIATQQKLLNSFLEQFRQKHSRYPKQIVVTPLALLALAIKRTVAPVWRGIPVVCREIDQHEATLDCTEAKSLGVFLTPKGLTADLVCTDLKT